MRIFLLMWYFFQVCYAAVINYIMKTTSIGRPEGDNHTCYSPSNYHCGGNHNHPGALCDLCPEEKKRFW